MNKNILKAIVHFKGVWPEDWSYFKPHSEENHRLAVCIKASKYASFSEGEIHQVLSNCDTECWSIICTREEFESFVESLFDGAPDGTTHIDGKTGFFYRDGSPFIYRSTKFSEALKIEETFRSKLIPHPRKQEVEREVDAMFEVVQESIDLYHACELLHKAGYRLCD